MRRNRRKPLDGIFYNTGDMNERTVDDSINVSRSYAESLQEPMFEEERIKHKKEAEERNRLRQNPTPDMKSDNGPGTAPGQSCL